MPKQSIQSVLGLPDTVDVRTMQTPLRLDVSAEDVRAAIPGDALNCAFAKCARRQFGGAAVIYRRVAYVEHTDAITGEKFIGKYAVPAATGRIARAFDTTGKMVPHGFELTPLTAARTPEGVKKYRNQVKNPRGPRKTKPRAPRDLFWRPPATGRFVIGLTEQRA